MASNRDKRGEILDEAVTWHLERAVWHRAQAAGASRQGARAAGRTHRVKIEAHEESAAALRGLAAKGV